MTLIEGLVYNKNVTTNVGSFLSVYKSFKIPVLTFQGLQTYGLAHVFLKH